MSTTSAPLQLFCPPYVNLKSIVTKKSNRDITIKNINLAIDNRTLILNSELSLNWDQRYGYIGRNGTGKSLLMKAIYNREGVFETIPYSQSIYLVEQEMNVQSNVTAFEYVIKSNKELEWLLEMQERLTNEDMDNIECDFDLDEIEDRLQELKSYRIESDVKRILLGLGFKLQDINTKTISEYSGGWRMRTALACSLFQKPDILLLDEPTNHLDIPAIIWLEDYLSTYPKTLLVVSHDPSFLNGVCNRIIHLENCKLNHYKGNYYDFTIQHKKNLELDSKKKKEIKKKIMSNENSTNKTDGKHKDKKRLKTSKSVDTKIKEIESTLQPIVKPIKPIVFNFPDPSNLSESAILKLESISFGYTDDAPLFRNINTGIYMNDRIGLIGSNGTGKSTIMKLLCGKLKESSGYVWRNPYLKVAYFNQHHVDNFENLEQTSIDYFMSKYKTNPGDLRYYLARFGLKDQVPLQPIKVLSGGQKTCLALADMAFCSPHILLLDEPTNHLDMEGVESLINGLKKFKGAILLISHNQHIIDMVTHELWIVTSNNEESFVKKYSGTFDKYKQEMINQIHDQAG